MARRPAAPYATIPVDHHALLQSRGEDLRRRPGPKSRKPECVVIGHAWTGDRDRDGGLICVVCEVVRRP